MTILLASPLLQKLYSILSIIALSATATLLLSSCAGLSSDALQREPVYRSLPSRPAWITQPPVNNDYFYALGISTDAPSLRRGRTLAAKNAIIEVSNYLGLQASGRFEASQTELTSRILNEVSVTTSASIKRSRLLKMYYEEFRHQDDMESAKSFDVYILLQIPMADLKREQQKQQQKNQALQAQAQATSQQALKYLHSGNFQLAWKKWLRAIALIDNISSNSAAATEIYHSALSAVEAIELSIREKQESAEHSGKLIVRAFYSTENGPVALQQLPLHLRLSNSSQAGQVMNTNSRGEVEYSLPTASAGLQVRIVMSPYTLDMSTLSAESREKITFLQSLLAGKLAQHGAMPFNNGSPPDINSQPASTAGKAAPLYSGNPGSVDIDIASSHPYILNDQSASHTLAVKVDIKPTLANNLRRPPLNLVVVIDKSGSMAEDGKIDYTRKATDFLIDHLSPQDYFSIVAYGTRVHIISESGPVLSRAVLKHQLQEIETGGMTNLSGGLFEAYTQVKKHPIKNGINSILLLSDGMANRGIIHMEELAPYIEQYRDEGIRVSSLGLGNDFNDELMMQLAELSNGNYYYIKNPEDIPGIFSRELTQLINIAARNIQVKVTLADNVRLANTFGRSYTLADKNTYLFRLGDLNFTERGILLFELELTQTTPGSRNIAQIETRYSSPDSTAIKQQSSTLAVSLTDDRALYQQSINQNVIKYIVLSRSIEEMERVLESLDQGLYDTAIKNIRSSYASIEKFARSSEDPEFLQRLSLLKHFEHEIEELMESGELHQHNEGIRKKLNYRLYLEKHSHRDIDHPLHIGN